ncbi:MULTISPECIES: ERF family protein [Streptococcus]|uniref:ERF family protein n=1 Tax=Streptococcus TaxID=1301 RepID=UPI0029C3E582|nr:ERF family protein [Streptococcus anginosus]MDX5003936.1 ERF family protein [Streptococcus anginosus]MDX5025416.1 ERF family protein [Streptococcus anginosus]MDX5034443.1 ERF family protein [Streptococcus anginosus]MDX5101590.1 ERF family protein [Streptococcus anginosus]
MGKIFGVLQSIQSELVAPKGQYNSFGKYNYRSAEDILEALKPILKKHKAAITMSDDIVYIEGRHYVEASVTLYAEGEAIGSKALAREEETKKGMDGSQITGTASSYARKYALNGLFAIDDNKDPDTDEYAEQTDKKSTNKAANKSTAKSNESAKNPANDKKFITGAQAKKLREDIKYIAESTNAPVITIGKWFVGLMGVEKIEQIPVGQLKTAQQLIEETKKVKGIE